MIGNQISFQYFLMTPDKIIKQNHNFLSPIEYCQQYNNVEKYRYDQIDTISSVLPN